MKKTLLRIWGILVAVSIIGVAFSLSTQQLRCLPRRAERALDFSNGDYISYD